MGGGGSRRPRRGKSAILDRIHEFLRAFLKEILKEWGVARLGIFSVRKLVFKTCGNLTQVFFSSDQVFFSSRFLKPVSGFFSWAIEACIIPWGPGTAFATVDHRGRTGSFEGSQGCRDVFSGRHQWNWTRKLKRPYQSNGKLKENLFGTY